LEEAAREAFALIPTEAVAAEQVKLQKRRFHLPVNRIASSNNLLIANRTLVLSPAILLFFNPGLSFSSNGHFGYILRETLFKLSRCGDWPFV
jgi:hypothetical protein